MPWVEMRLRGAKVLARVGEDGRPRAEGGRVEVRYKPNDGRAYRAAPANLSPIPGAQLLPDDHCAPAEEAPRPRSASGAGGAKRTTKAKKASVGAPAHPDGAIIVYADGACTGNPGPAGLGVVVVEDGKRTVLSEYVGVGTNNIAELTAILRAAQRLAGRAEPVRMFTDSKYSIGVLTQGWKAKKNPELVSETKKALAQLEDVELHYVPGHAGVELNELADELARRAVKERETLGWQ